MDGDALPTSYRVGLPSPDLEEVDIAGWHAFEISFAAEQTRQVKNTYLIRPVRFSNGQALFTYLLRTGALWKGVIGQADIVVHPSGGLEVANLEAMRGSFSPSSSPVQVFGKFTATAALAVNAGRAVEVWAEHQPSGTRATSTLLLIEGKPRALPPSGEPLMLLLQLGVVFALGGLGLHIVLPWVGLTSPVYETL